MNKLQKIFCGCYTFGNNSLEKKKNEQEMQYISLGLKQLNEKFILIDAEKKTYKLLDTVESNTKRVGTYNQFIQYLQKVVVKESDREFLSSNLSLDYLTHTLSSNSYISVPLELNIAGKHCWNLLSFVVIEHHGTKISKILLASRDITDTQKEEVKQQQLLTDALKQAEDISKAKSTFLFNMSHDIRIPMNAIIGFTNMAKKHLDERDVVEDYLNKVEKSNQHMMHLINDILDLARIDSGKVKLESAPINIYKECYAIDELFRSSMEEKQIEFSVAIDVNDELIMGDAMRIKQIIVNLTSNALKYTKPGGKVTIRYSQEEYTKEGLASFKILVRDNGIGMSQEYQKHLFEAFEREKTTAENGVQGTGLGLAISKQLADLMGGTLSCKSKQGIGTEFLFCFKAPVIGAAKYSNADNLDISCFKNKRILLAEDNTLNREITVDILEELGFVVEEAVDGAEAVEKVRNSKAGYYQFVLMDIQMPYMNGYEATQRIRELLDKDLASIPIIAITGNVFDEDIKKVMSAGMNAHLPKPIDVRKIMETIYQFV